MDNFNQLTNSQTERLALLLEELGEAQQAIGKILRHGYDSCHPDGGPDNRDRLESELGDVQDAIRRLCSNAELNQKNINRAEIAKAMKVVKYLHHNDD